MAKERTIYLGFVSQGRTQWADSFITTFRETVQSFFKNPPTLLTSDGKTDKSTLSAITAWFVVVPATESNDEKWKKEIHLLEEIIKENPKYPVYFIKESDYISGELSNLGKEFSTFDFFDIDPENNQPRKYRLDGTSVESVLFWSQLVDICYELSDILHKESISSGKSKNAKVYIAPVTPDLTVTRNRLVRELRQRKIEILPDANKKQSNVGDATDDILSEVTMAIHLIGYQHGENFPGTRYSMTENYCRQTSAFCTNKRDELHKKGVNTFRLVSIPMEVEKADESQKQFIQSLRYDSATDFTEIVQLPVEDLKLLILERVHKKETTGLLSVDPSTTYLIYDQQSPVQASKVSALLRAEGLQVNTLNYLDTKITLLDQHRWNLAKAGSVIIVDSNSPDQWLLSKIKDIIKSPGIGRSAPFQLKAILTENSEHLSQIAKQNGFTLLPFGETLAQAIKTWKNKQITQ